MGSWFSSSAPAPPPASHEIDWQAACIFLMNHQDLIMRSPQLQEHYDAMAMRDLANKALTHYNSNHPGAVEFHCPRNLTLKELKELELKAACVGFRKDLWYHINFLARPRGGDAIETQRFFAELRFDPCSDRLFVETCIVLGAENPFRISCALCPDESKILHPSDAGCKCGKQGHEDEFFRYRCGIDGRTKEFFDQSDMLQTPFNLGSAVPRYRLDYVEE